MSMKKNKKNKNNLPRVPYALAVFGGEERKAVADVLKTPMIVPGALVKQFENKISAMFGKRHGVMVNSGSSANLLAFELLNLPKGSEVITPVLTFGTTLAPILQKGLVPAFADIVPGEYVIDVGQIEKLINKKTRALMIPSLIGNIPDYRKLSGIAKKHNLWLVEDSCDTLGATLYGKPTGVYSDISVTSFYASHIITTAGSGGMICFNDPLWLKRAKTLTGWGRASAINEKENAAERFKEKVDGISYDGKFIFNEIGYNFQSTEIAAAFGLEQIKKFKAFFDARERNFKILFDFFKNYEHFFILPKQNPGVKTAWLAFPLTLRDNAPFARQELTGFLENRNIQTRPIFTGNVLRQPAFRKIRCRKIKKGYPAADLVMRGSILLGCHQGLTEKQMDYLKNTFCDFFNRFSL